MESLNGKIDSTEWCTQWINDAKKQGRNYRTFDMNCLRLV